MSAYKKAKLSKKEQKFQAKKADRVIQRPTVPIEVAPKIKKDIQISTYISVSDLSKKLNLSVTDVIKTLIKNGVMATINENIDFDTASIIGDELGFNIIPEESLKKEKEIKKEYKGKSVSRPPIVTIMGHVDHGKTSILDYIRKTHVTEGESGGITQHIGAYQAEKKNRIITFIDTPGHEAFSKMRAHGANITDIVILVVAATDGVKPQTIEAIDHSKNANVPIIVAINKIDVPGADIEKVKRELSDYGLLPEEWGGDTVMVNVSAKTGEGIDGLLDMVLLIADLKNYQANPEEDATAIIIESKIEKGKGFSATVLVQNGTLKINDAIVAGRVFGKIRTMEDYAGKKIKLAGPSTPVRISGLSEVVEVGESMISTDDLKIAREIASQNALKESVVGKRDENKVMMRDLAEKVASGEIQELKIIVKSDVKGSLDALNKVISDIKTEKVALNLIRTGTGDISETDIMLARAAGALIFGFRVKIDTQIAKLAEVNKVIVKSYDVIYELVDDLKNILSGLIAPEIVEIETAKAKIVQIFRDDNKIKVVGCSVLEGKASIGQDVKIKRNDEIILATKIISIRREKSEVKDIIAGSDCGISLPPKTDVQVGDLLIPYKTESHEITL
ncbi:MAG: translation initiation factor IF-2 [Patescibacteria group bacterium]